MPQSRGASASDRRVRVAVASDQRLVAEAVAAALSGRGLDAVVHEPEVAPADVGLLLYDVDGSLRMSRAIAVLRSWPGPWLAVTRAPPGPAWGGLLGAGARTVLPQSADLAVVEQHLRRLAEDRMIADEDAAYVAAWQEFQAGHGDLQRRLASLLPREMEVLELMCRGLLVVEIAHRRGLAETTVRTQVRAILRKLGVRTQLAATALLRAADEAAG